MKNIGVYKSSDAGGKGKAIFLCFSFAIAPVYSCFANTYIIVDHTNNTKH